MDLLILSDRWMVGTSSSSRLSSSLNGYLRLDPAVSSVSWVGGKTALRLTNVCLATSVVKLAQEFDLWRQRAQETFLCRSTESFPSNTRETSYCAQSDNYINLRSLLHIMFTCSSGMTFSTRITLCNNNSPSEFCILPANRRLMARSPIGL